MDETSRHHHFLFSAESSRVNVWVGLLAWRCRPWCSWSAAASPSPAHAEWLREAASSLTVAGPRRIRTGLPCYAPLGHPDRDERYTTLHKRRRRSMQSTRSPQSKFGCILSVLSVLCVVRPLYAWSEPEECWSYSASTASSSARSASCHAANTWRPYADGRYHRRGRPIAPSIGGSTCDST